MSSIFSEFTVHKVLFIAAFSLASATPALAQSRTDNLRAALNAAPELLLTNPDPFQFTFFDVDAWRGETHNLSAPQASLRINFGDMIAPLATLRMGGPENWPEKAGISLDEIAWFGGFGFVPQTITYWGFKDEGQLKSLIDSLQTRDFEYVGESDILGNGEPLAINIEQRDPLNPWRGGVGQASFIQAEGKVLLQSGSVPEAIEGLRPVAAPLADHVVVATALAGLNAALPDDASIVQAALISPTFGLDALDPMSVISPSGSLQETRANLEAAMAEAGQGIPPYLGGFLADIALNGRSGFAISLSYADCATAEQAIESIGARWDAALAADLAARQSDLAVEGEGDLCAATVILVADDETLDLSGQIYQRILRRDFSLLQIGTPS